MSDLPPLPKIDGDFELMLDIYTHSSVRTNPTMTEDYGDTERLAELGAKVLDLVITYHLYSERPFLTAKNIQEKRLELTSDVSLNRWVQAYGLQEKLRVAPSEIAVLSNPEELRKLFHTYIGALYIRNGLATIQKWISRMIDPAIDIKLPNLSPQPESQFQPQPPQMHAYGQQWQGQGYGQQQGYQSPPPSQVSATSYSSSQMNSVHPAPPPGAPPPLPASPPVMMPSSAMSLVTLALVNQTAAQRGYYVTYPAEQTGPPHQPTWTVRCCMNGQEYGIGSGKSQKLAKEEAARMAWAAMGWGPT
ncbi:hypothetical protein CPB84DRAFT_1957520 [Gymnopilus junonius]|uniref:Uncharacterized protein n=1 Tax=Gymnopilus junonius TaxID=109634 RepID=A0A9P5TTG4_GYMJU|nr:hypothetical protein CPB84DRAFT_1957520 [Gymnopilus junonius]